MKRWGRAEGQPLIIGHRGASAHEVENTLPAFARARADGADGVELDVHRCGSGEVIVFHDEDLTRLAGRPDRVADLPLAALREVQLRGGPGIPTLDEVIEALGPMLLNVELKAGRLPPAGLVRAVVTCLRRHSLGDRLILSSFNPLVLAELALRAPDLPRAFLFAANQSLPLRRAWPRTIVRPAALHPEHVLATADRVREWHGQGYAVNCWTVDDPAALRRLAAAGVDGVIANDPGRARALLAEGADSRR